MGTWCPIFRAAAWERGIHIQGNGSPENLKQARKNFFEFGRGEQNFRGAMTLFPESSSLLSSALDCMKFFKSFSSLNIFAHLSLPSSSSCSKFLRTIYPFSVQLSLLPRRWRQQSSLKCLYLFTIVCCFTFETAVVRVFV